MWEPTGKKATDRTTGAKLIEQQQPGKHSYSKRWEVSLDDVVLGYVDSYEGHKDTKAPGSRIVTRRVIKTMWSCVKIRKEGMPYQRTWYGHATRARAVFCLVNY